MTPDQPAPDELVIVALSGGVDSSVAAHLLVEQGCRVEGLFMFNWDPDDGGCTAARDFEDARAVCRSLGIALHRADFSREYRERVFEPFLEHYRAGQTPNPDVLCNREIKFGVLLDHARRLGADRLATGHYARLDRDRQGRVRLRRGADPAKDQSYFLHMAPEDALARAMFPLGQRYKSEVRRIAAEAGFGNHDKADSTGLCFVGERDFPPFLARYLTGTPGDMETPDGARVGRHDGLIFYTLGQRRGLGIGGLRGYDERPWYVVAKDPARNVLIVGQGRDHPLLYSRGLEARELHWVQGGAPPLPARCTAQVRYRHPAAPCTVRAAGPDRLRVVFDEPQWAVTPGQSVVLYQGDICLGGGVIHAPSADDRAAAS